VQRSALQCCGSLEANIATCSLASHPPTTVCLKPSSAASIGRQIGEPGNRTVGVAGRARHAICHKSKREAVLSPLQESLNFCEEFGGTFLLLWIAVEEMRLQGKYLWQPCTPTLLLGETRAAAPRCM
jgi:hypothetical protein